jgi:hypothetical protein
MAALSKPKARINHNPDVKEKKQNRTVFESRDTSFVFSDDVSDWITGKSNAAKKFKPLF